MDNKDGNETEESGDYNETSINRPSIGSIGSDGDYDDELGVPGSIKVVDMGDGPVAIEHSDEDVEDETTEHIGHNAIHNYKKFTSFNRDVFIPGLDITAAVTDYERNLTSHMLNPNLYTISLTHGNFSWEIKKRYKQFQYLHQQLILFRTSLNIPLPTKTHKNKRKTLKINTKAAKAAKRKMALPRFPKKPEVLVSYDRIGNRMKQIESYLNNLLSIPLYRNHPATIEFLEVSHLSFVEGLGTKGKESFVKKRTGSTRPGQTGCTCFGLYHGACCVKFKHCRNDIFCSRYVKRWFFLKDTFFGYLNPDNGRIRTVILFDQGFEVASGMYGVGLQNVFQVQTLSRQMIFKCWTKRKSKEWTEALKQVAASTANDFIYANRYHSFVPTRINVMASWFVDGSSYMSAVAEAIESAKEEIFITDWWLSPEIYLKRPAVGDYWQLKKVLERKADSGVRVYILLYKEVELALGLNSYYSKQKLTDSSPYIKVLRHPDHAKTGVFLWAHHEKMVVIDQTYAFVGGIDLCYGRWDDDKHKLTDLGNMTPTPDITNLKIKTSSVPYGENSYPIPVPYYKQNHNLDSQHSEVDIVDIDSNLPQLQPGDNLLIPQKRHHPKLNTPEAERKQTYLNSLKNKGKEFMNLVYSPHEHDILPESETPDHKSIDEVDGTKTPDQFVDNVNGSSKLWIGKDYVNFIVKDFTNLESPFDDFIDRTTTPRMPWHDIGMCVQGDAARDVARHFIQRWNAAKLEKAKNNDAYNYLLPKAYGTYKTLPINFPNQVHKVSCQVLRSVSCWSCGFLEADTVEQSIHEAYIDTITKAQHYIYIENQFFVSLARANPYTKNQIGEALFKRIIRAHKSKEVFRVYVVMPLLPGFEGEVGGPSGTSLHAVTHWNYASISQGKDAILTRLKDAGIEDPSNYITFYGLREHDCLNSEPITELIYVHSKLMIVDDKKVICGSANINDRSLIGKRDSEIAVLIEDEVFEDGVMNGEAFPCGKFAGSLRKYLFEEHLGLLNSVEVFEEINVQDPVSESFYREVWYKTAELNTELYENVFHCIPTDTVQTFVDLKKIQEEKPLWVDELSRAEKMLETIQGHLVLLPLNFLSKENLMPAASSAEGWMPTSLWI